MNLFLQLLGNGIVQGTEGTVHTHGTQKEVLENPAVRELYMGLSGGMSI